MKAGREKRTIAGQQADCLKSGDIVALGLFDVTLCYAANGVPLLFHWRAGNDTLTMEATSYSGTVADKDLELPATPSN